MTCQQSFYRAPVLRPRDSDVTSIALASDLDRIKVAPYWMHHPSFVTPEGRYSLPNDFASVGWEGGPQNASVFFRRDFGGTRLPPSGQGAYCRCSANCLTTLVRANRLSTLDPYKGADPYSMLREPAVGSVTVKAYFSDNANQTQRDAGIFVRMRSVVSSVRYEDITGVASRDRFEDRLLPGTFVALSKNGGLYGDGSALRITHNGVPSALSPYVDPLSLFDSHVSPFFYGAYGQQSPRRGMTYLQASHVFEFGTIVGGVTTVHETQRQVDGSDRFITLGMDRRSAFACVSSVDGWAEYPSSFSSPAAWKDGVPPVRSQLWNWFLPRITFQPLTVNVDVAEDFSRHQPLDGCDRHPLRFDIETEQSAQTVFMNAESLAPPPASGLVVAEGYVRLPNVTATPWEGREVHDIRARVATSTAASRATSFADHEQYAFMQAMTDAASYRAAEIGYWPGWQPQTDISVPVGSSACSQLTNAGLTLSITSSATLKSQLEAKRSSAMASMRAVARTSALIPRWPTQVQLGGSYSGVPAIASDFGSLLDEYGSSKYGFSTSPIAESAPTSIGHFGDCSVTLKQLDQSGNSIIGQWYCHEDKNVSTPRLSTGADPQSFTTTFLLSTRDTLWREWNDKMLDESLTDWNVLWTYADVGSGFGGLQAGIDRPYLPLTNRNSITAFEIDRIEGFQYYGEDLTRYHYVDDFEATKHGNSNFIGIPPGPDINGVQFTTRWTQAKTKFLSDIQSLWTRCCDFSESVEFIAYSKLDSVEARAQFVLNRNSIISQHNANPVFRATQETAAAYPAWSRLVQGASTAASKTGVVTSQDAELDISITGNVRDVTEVNVYKATASFGTPVETLRVGDQWRDAVGIRKTPTSRVYAVPCTVTFFTDLKTPTKTLQFNRKIGYGDVRYSGFAVSSDTGQMYLKSESTANDPAALKVLAASSCQVSWA
jgi:hypothetical protein